jgi:hypothetical protein
LYAEISAAKGFELLFVLMPNFAGFPLRQVGEHIDRSPVI